MDYHKSFAGTVSTNIFEDWHARLRRILWLHVREICGFYIKALSPSVDAESELQD